jgi:hypothetical protein
LNNANNYRKTPIPYRFHSQIHVSFSDGLYR